MRVKQSTIVVTGASTGIGRTCALYLDRKGFRVFATVRHQEDAKSLQRIATSHLTPIFLDVTKPDMITTAVETVTKMVGSEGLSGLVNNAGVAIAGPLEFLPLDDLKWQLEINVVGQLAVTQAFLPLLRRGQGRVINMSSISGLVAMPFVGPYAASKFALEALNDSLRVELRPWGIKVISLQPGAIATPIWEKTVSKADDYLAQMPAEGQRLYGSYFTTLRRSALRSGESGIPPETVARVVAQALTAKRPKMHYRIGWDAKLGAFLTKILPVSVRDWVIVQGNKWRGRGS